MQIYIEQRSVRDRECSYKQFHFVPLADKVKDECYSLMVKGECSSLMVRMSVYNVCGWGSFVGMSVAHWWHMWLQSRAVTYSNP